ncbi:MAG: hypothetical protein AVDCRST_MAG56-3245 [uncultured Cytophagales bacterium]|uniref:Uncharacterized protein n=1 Tax=uncultured Cytophagales bacterium TaxID=158755 RepID=A0A6J4JC31_9SPHI|nr:MAG: hypothetical protein AVDCRST_MAG56-3245 [uncultured Cytophagales bacterium]
MGERLCGPVTVNATKGKVQFRRMNFKVLRNCKSLLLLWRITSAMKQDQL